MERITTIITTYNHRDFIGEAIESALGQVGHFVHTILIADDASTDGTREIVRQYAQKYPSVIRDISPDVNLGISGNMRRAFGMVEDDYVAILEGDDYWTDTGKLEKQLQFLKQRDDCSMVFSRIRIHEGSGSRLLHRHDGLPDRLGVDTLCNYHDSCNLICNFSCCLFKTKLLRSLPDVAYEGRLSEVVVALFMVKFGWVGYLGECLGDYRLHSGNVFQSADRQSQLEQEEQTFLTASKIADESVVPMLLRKADAARRELSLLRVNSGKGLAISIVTICRNDLQGLRRTAASVLTQTADRCEWIVIDGGSTDGSAEYIRSELAPHVSYWCSEPDGGIYEALNKGVAHARGEYVIAMNSGDAFAAPDVLRNCLANEFKADVVYGDWIRRYPDHEEKRQAPQQLKPFHFIRLDLPNICHQAMFVRTSLLKDSPYDVRYRVLADYAKWQQFMLEGRTFQYVPVTICRFQAGGLSEVRTLAGEMDMARLRSWCAECGLGEVVRFVQKVNCLQEMLAASRDRQQNSACWRMARPFRFVLDNVKGRTYGKLVRGTFKQFVPYGCMVWWMKRRYGECIDMPLLYYPGMGKRLRRVVKFALPYCLTSLLKRPRSGESVAPGPEMPSFRQGVAWLAGESGLPQGLQREVDIIIPVYNGYDFLPALFASLGRTEVPFRVIVIDDCSPDKRILPYLKEQAVNFKEFVLLENSANLGFVQSVNKGLASSTRDVVLLNTDTELPNRWLERLMNPIWTEPGIASATPFTNSGTICSFPRFLENNDLPSGVTLESMDAVFAQIRPRYEEAPTGVGFCMAMSRKAVEKVGVLDAETFYKGYGEENDWCQRAIQMGFRNVIVENLFVWHKHGGSFLPADKKRYIDRNLALINRRYPNYEGDVREFVRRNPHRELRALLKARLLAANPNGCTLVFDLDWGGGAEDYARNYMRQEADAGRAVVRIVDNVRTGLFAEYGSGDLSDGMHLDSIGDLSRLLEGARFANVVVSELVAFKDLPATLDFIVALKGRTDARLVTLVHDFFAICPSLNLLASDGRHCGYPDIGTCRRCIARNANRNAYGYQSADIDSWRTMWRRLLLASDEIRCFSENTRSYLEHHFGQLQSCAVVPHELNFHPQPLPPKAPKKKLVIATLGNLAFHKGADILCGMRDIIESGRLPIKLVHIGRDQSEKDLHGIAVHGAYAREELPSLLRQYDVDVVFIASIWPETFSYTTLEAMRLGVPVASFAIGAPAERISEYKDGVIIPEISADCAVQTLERWWRLRIDKGVR